MKEFVLGYITYENMISIMKPLNKERTPFFIEEDKTVFEIHAKDIEKITIKQTIVASDEVGADKKLINKILDGEQFIIYDTYKDMAPEIILPLPLMKTDGVVIVTKFKKNETYNSEISKIIYCGEFLEFVKVKHLRNINR